MKIQELIEFEDELNFNEALDTRFDSIHWDKLSTGGYKGTGHLNDMTYVMLIEPGILPIATKKYTFLNIAFALEIDDNITTTFQNNSSNSSKIFGAISNALNEKNAEFLSVTPIKFIVFATKSDYTDDGILIKSAEQKLKAYHRMISSNLYGLSDWSPVFAQLQLKSDQLALIAMRNKPSVEEWSTIKDFFMNRGKTFY